MIVHGVGNIAAPDELLAHALVQKLGPLKMYREYFSIYGAVSGGTYNNSKVMFENITESELEILNDPFAFGGVREGGVRESDKAQLAAAEDPHFPGIWTAPAYNTQGGVRCLRRSCALFEERPGEGVAYGRALEVSIVSPYVRKNLAENQMNNMGPVNDMGTCQFLAKQHKDTQDSGQMPLPGSGPPPNTRKLYSSEVYAIAEGENGEKAHAHLAMGEAYELTAMYAVAGALVLCQELDVAKPKERGGILTPGYAFHGTTWADRLKEDRFACDPAGRPVVIEVGEGWPSEEDIKKAATEINKTMLAGQSKIMKGEVKPWL